MKILAINVRRRKKLIVDNEEIEEVKKHNYLKSVITKKEGTDKENGAIFSVQNKLKLRRKFKFSKATGCLYLSMDASLRRSQRTARTRCKFLSINF